MILSKEIKRHHDDPKQGTRWLAGWVAGWTMTLAFNTSANRLAPAEEHQDCRPPNIASPRLARPPVREWLYSHSANGYIATQRMAI